MSISAATLDDVFFVVDFQYLILLIRCMTWKRSPSDISRSRTSEHAGRLGNHFGIASRFLALGYCCKSKLVSRSCFPHRLRHTIITFVLRAAASSAPCRLDQSPEIVSSTMRVLGSVGKRAKTTLFSTVHSNIFTFSRPFSRWNDLPWGDRRSWISNNLTV